MPCEASIVPWGGTVRVGKAGYGACLYTAVNAGDSSHSSRILVRP